MVGDKNPRFSEADPHLSQNRLSNTSTPEQVFDRIERHSPDDPYTQASNLILLTGLSARINSAQESSRNLVPVTVLDTDGKDMHIAVLLRMHKAGELLYETSYAEYPPLIAYEYFLKESNANHRQFLGDLSLAALDLIHHRTGENETQLRIVSMDRFLCDKSERFFLRSMLRHFERPDIGILDDFEPAIMRAYWYNKSYWEAKYTLPNDIPTNIGLTTIFINKIQDAISELPLEIDLG